MLRYGYHRTSRLINALEIRHPGALIRSRSNACNQRFRLPPFGKRYFATSKPEQEDINKVEGTIKQQNHSQPQNNPLSMPQDTKKTFESIAENENSQEVLGDTNEEYLTTIFDNMDPYLDTYSVYTQLVESGFKPSQADEILDLIIVQLNSKMAKMPNKFSQTFELENERYLFESAQQELRVDITRSREQHINELISLINILQRDFHIISDELNNAFLQMKNDSQVAVNDQKSENTLMSKKIMLKIQETNHKITTELNSAMRSEIESLRWHLSRWGLIAILICVFGGCVTFYLQKARTVRKEQSKSDFIPLVIYEPSELDEDDYHTDIDRNLIE